MIIALLIYLAANQGVLVAAPIVVNSLAIGSIVSEATIYDRGYNSGRCDEELR